MRVQVRVTPRAKRAGIARAEDGTLLVRVREPAEGGRANTAVVAAVAAHFGIPKQVVRIVHGFTSRRKLIELTP